jgi:hypothetical protein
MKCACLLKLFLVSWLTVIKDVRKSKIDTTTHLVVEIVLLLLSVVDKGYGVTHAHVFCILLLLFPVGHRVHQAAERDVQTVQARTTKPGYSHNVSGGKFDA